MNATKTLEAVSIWCKANSGDPQIWAGNKSTYHWNLGKTTQKGIVNGVVRKLAGIDVSGRQIWVVAGSLKVLPDGTIARFTGLPKSVQKQMVVEPAVVTTQETVTA
jgi:hypothetical protein